MWARRRVGAGDECVQNPSVCAESWARPLGGPRRVAVGPRQEPTPLHLWTTSGGCRDRLVYSCRLVCACLKSVVGRASGTHATIEGSDVSEKRLSSRCRSAWARPVVLFCMGSPHARMVSLWSFSRPALASRKRLADQWLDEWRSSNSSWWSDWQSTQCLPGG